MMHLGRVGVLQTLSLLALFSVPLYPAGPILAPKQVETAIQRGAKYKTKDKFLENGLKGKRVKLASSMALDGISKYATFFNDWNAVAAESAAARQQLRQLQPEDVESAGLLHAFVEIHARGAIPASKLNRRYLENRAHLVLQIGDRVVQPVSKNMIKRSDQSPGMVLAGVPSGKITLDFAFDVSPENLQTPVEVILIDGDGNRHQAKADLKGILDFN